MTCGVTVCMVALFRSFRPVVLAKSDLKFLPGKSRAKMKDNNFGSLCILVYSIALTTEPILLNDDLECGGVLTIFSLLWSRWHRLYKIYQNLYVVKHNRYSRLNFFVTVWICIKNTFMKSILKHKSSKTSILSSIDYWAIDFFSYSIIKFYNITKRK